MEISSSTNFASIDINTDRGLNQLSLLSFDVNCRMQSLQWKIDIFSFGNDDEKGRLALDLIQACQDFHNLDAITKRILKNPQNSSIINNSTQMLAISKEDRMELQDILVRTAEYSSRINALQTQLIDK